MDDLVFADVSFGETGADPERFATRGVWDISDVTDVDVSFLHTIEHWEHAPLPFDFDDRAFSTLPDHVRSALAPQEQSIATDALESHSDRHPLVSTRIVARER